MKTTIRNLRRLILTLLCVCITAFPAWAAEDQASQTSRVITAGAGEATVEAEPVAEEPEAAPVESGQKGASLGIFSTTGYCNCRKCSNGHNLTYSGTVPQARHTVSADLSRYPIGTRLMIDDVIYTVEDMGSGVNGNSLDIYYASHEEALAHGRKKQEVFVVN